jgi:hypothetical protein
LALYCVKIFNATISFVLHLIGGCLLTGCITIMNALIVGTPRAPEEEGWRCEEESRDLRFRTLFHDPNLGG